MLKDKQYFSHAILSKSISQILVYSLIVMSYFMVNCGMANTKDTCCTGDNFKKLREHIEKYGNKDDIRSGYIVMLNWELDQKKDINFIYDSADNLIKIYDHPLFYGVTNNDGSVVLDDFNKIGLGLTERLEEHFCYIVNLLDSYEK